METKLLRGIYLTLGITFALIVGIIVLWKLKFYDQVTADLEKANGEYETASRTAQGLSKNLLAAAVAEDRIDLAAEQLTYFRSRFRSLNFDLTDDGRRNVTWRGYMNEYFANFGLNMRRELIQAAQDTNVILVTSVKVEAPFQMPENVMAPPSGFLKPVAGGGTISVDVVGPMPNILEFLQRINRSAILMSVGYIKLEGPSPLTKATFTITPYLVARGPAVDAILTAPAGTTTAATTPGTDPDGISGVPSPSPTAPVP